jgi:hypothetical protein
MPPLLGVRHIGTHDGDAARIRDAELANRIERHCVVGAIDARRHDHHALRADPRLHFAIRGHIRCVDKTCHVAMREERAVIDVDVRIASAWWRVPM